MNCKDFNTHFVSRVIGAGMIITLSTAALAQDSPRLRTPRRTTQGAIETKDAPSAAPTAIDPNQAQGPGPGPIGPGPGCNLFPAPPSVGANVASRASGRHRPVLTKVSSASCNCLRPDLLTTKTARLPFPFIWVT